MWRYGWGTDGPRRLWVFRSLTSVASPCLFISMVLASRFKPVGIMLNTHSYMCVCQLMFTVPCGCAARDVVLFVFIGTAGDSESYGQVSISSCSSKPEPPNGLVTIKLSSGSAHHVCLNGFNRGAAAAVCRQLGYLDADSVPKSDGEYVFYGPPDLYEYVHHFASLFFFLSQPASVVTNTVH